MEMQSFVVLAFRCTWVGEWLTDLYQCHIALYCLQTLALKWCVLAASTTRQDLSCQKGIAYHELASLLDMPYLHAL